MTWLRGLYERYQRSLWQLIRFGAVGGLGVVVNMVVLILLAKFLPHVWPGAAIHEGAGVVWNVPGTDFNVRWKNVMSATAFLLANVFNFQLNRWWTFKSHRTANWFREYGPFLTVGLISLAVGQFILNALTHDGSVIELPTSVFDGSSGLRNRFYWANLIMIICTIPISFLVNKFWTFRAVRNLADTEELEHPEEFIESGHEA